jgi:hypothetical protein
MSVLGLVQVPLSGGGEETFKDAKEAAQRFFEECPTEVIQCFINRSWWFMSAYQKGLTGTAAAWAVRKMS